MTIEERNTIHRIIDTLTDVQAVAPSNSTYSQGRTQLSVSYRLLDIIRELSEVSDYEPETAEATTDDILRNITEKVSKRGAR